MNPLASPIPYQVSQVAIVVCDLDAAMQRYTERHGWGPWSVYDYVPPQLRDLRQHGEAASFTWVGAETDVGEVGIELLAPVSGGGLFAEWLDAHGEGVHHVGYAAATVEEAREIHAALEATGAAELASAWIDGVWFYYMDTAPVILEVWAGEMASVRASRTYP
jgi:hypothetical protein